MDVGRHPKITLLAYSQVEKVEGEVGNFKVTVRKRARYVDESKCTGCGACAEKCPTVVPDDYNMGFADRKAIYRYFSQGIPSTYTIDTTVCRQFQEGKKCGICSKICQAKAINYEQTDQVLEIEVGAIITAVGYDLFDAFRIPEYGYGRIPNVITAMELERFLSASGPTHGHLFRPSDLKLKSEFEDLEKKQQKMVKALERQEKKHNQSSDEFYKKFEAGEVTGEEFEEWARQVKEFKAFSKEFDAKQEQVNNIGHASRLAFLQCVGSRDIRFNPHCSSFCCMHAIKEAIIAKEHDPHAELYIFGMDIRAVGKGFEEYRNRGAKNVGIQYVRSRVAEITQTKDKSPVVWYEDTLTREVKQLEVDLVILATACEASQGSSELAKLLDIERDPSGFYRTTDDEPLDTSRPGIYTCGCAQGPKDIPESVAQASSAAARAAQVLKQC
jgi:heterodisulfide reductase subunit A-like polyferredoxin